MNANASPSYAKKLQAKGKSPGWAAFDLKQRQKQRLPEVGNDPFPPLPTTSTTSFRPCGNPPSNNGYFEGSYSSVLLPSADFPRMAEDSNCNKYTRVSDYGQVEVIEEKKPAFVLNHLKELHSWADKSLIEDVMAAVNGDIDKATIFLGEMISTDNSEENGEAKCFSNCDDFQCDTEEDESVLLGQNSDLAADIADLSSTLEDALKGNNKQSKNVHAACGRRLSEAAAANMKLILGHIRSFPVEPEWEEHDVYLSHRRNALRMMRLAARHSRAATNAFLRGDHFSAQQNSLKARKEWLNAERLNAKAAKEILSIRNSENNPWKLDLHGLHAAEAVKALQEHLNKIEALLLKDRPVSPDRFKTKNGIVSSSLKPFIGTDMENLDKQQAGLRHRTVSLQVITGIGNHSRGQAAIPTAVRSFLSENGYHFDEARPGVISVRPKFRHR